MFFFGFSLNAYCQSAGNGVTDIDGNTYNSVNIGTQEWQKENLTVSKYSDGTVIPQVTDPTVWGSLTTGAWCYYNNNPANGAIYGKLYNWYAAVGIYDAASLSNPALRKKLAPTGWHVPIDAEWTTLTTFLGGETIAGGKMKETGTTRWQSPNTGATNSSGFTGLPAGQRYMNATFTGGVNFCYWLSSSEYTTTNVWALGLYYADSYSYRDGGLLKTYGNSVRCINDIALHTHSFNDNSFKIYPNPAKDQITIDCGNNSNVIGWSYKIVNTLGQEVIKGKINLQQNIVRLNSLDGQGMYFVKIINAQNEVVSIKKIILQ